MMKLGLISRQDIARAVWNLFIHNVEKVKVHYGKNIIFIVVKLDEDIDTEGVTEAHMLDRHGGYQELINVPMRRGE